MQDAQNYLEDILANCVVPSVEGKKKIKAKLREIIKKQPKSDGKGVTEECAINVSDYDSEGDSEMVDDDE